MQRVLYQIMYSGIVKEVSNEFYTGKGFGIKGRSSKNSS